MYLAHVYVELIRCREHPEREREYVLQFYVDGIKFWLPETNTVSFEWKIKSIRRAQYHNNVGKVEIEVGRLVILCVCIYVFVYVCATHDIS